MPVAKHIIEQIRALVPPMNGALHKGQSGRVGVLGGALEYVAYSDEQAAVLTALQLHGSSLLRVDLRPANGTCAAMRRIHAGFEPLHRAPTSHT